MGAWGIWGAVLAATLGAGSTEAARPTLTLQVDGPPTLESFLVERMRETWDPELALPARRAPQGADVEAAPAGARPPLWVAVSALGPDLWTVRVSLAEELLTDRTLEVRDAT